MADFNEEDIKNLSIDEINELYKEIIEMPAPLIGGVACGDSLSSKDCCPKGGIVHA